MYSNGKCELTLIVRPHLK